MKERMSTADEERTGHCECGRVGVPLRADGGLERHDRLDGAPCGNTDGRWWRVPRTPILTETYRVAVVGFSPSSGAPRRGLVSATNRRIDGASLSPGGIDLDKVPLGALVTVSVKAPSSEEVYDAAREAAVAEEAFLASREAEAAAFWNSPARTCRSCARSSGRARSASSAADEARRAGASVVGGLMRVNGGEPEPFVADVVPEEAKP